MRTVLSWSAGLPKAKNSCQSLPCWNSRKKAWVRRWLRKEVRGLRTKRSSRRYDERRQSSDGRTGHRGS
eukprot:2375908-Heterocapsa_arctica.AAC.1